VRDADRIVITLPLRELRNESGPVAGQRGEYVDRGAIRALLRMGPIRFVVANCGFPLHWVTVDECWSFWKGELLDHTCPNGPVDLDAFDQEYSYFASRWTLASGEQVVVLEKVH
jgi:hypothetical protein